VLPVVVVGVMIGPEPPDPVGLARSCGSDEHATNQMGARNGKIQKEHFRRKADRVEASTRVNAVLGFDRSFFEAERSAHLSGPRAQSKDAVSAASPRSGEQDHGFRDAHDVERQRCVSEATPGV
jgi:hypothetical protein